MSQQERVTDQILQAFSDHGITAAIGVWFTFIAGLATAVTRKAFTNEALLHKLEQGLAEERARVETRCRSAGQQRPPRPDRTRYPRYAQPDFAALQRRDGD